MKPTDFELGVELASGIYKDVIREYAAKNTKLWELCEDMYEWMERAMYDGSLRKHEYELIVSRMHYLGFDVELDNED